MKPILAQIENLSDFAYIFTFWNNGKNRTPFSCWILMHHICIKYRAKWKMPRHSLFWCNIQENNVLSQWGFPKTPHLYLTYTSLDTSLLSWWRKWGLSEVYLTYLTRLYRPIYRGWSLTKWVSEVNHALPLSAFAEVKGHPPILLYQMVFQNNAFSV